MDKETRYTGKVPANCQLLLGPHYALLRDEFRQWRQQVKLRSGQASRILVFFGGVDADNFTGLTIEALSGLGMSGLHIDVVIGAQHPFREQIESACSEYKFFCYVQTDRMAELMASADLAIGAGGSATWERCCLGVPCIVIAVAENQIQAARDLSLLGAIQFIGSGNNLNQHNVSQLLMKAFESNCYEIASKIGMELVDGKGTYCIIKTMEII